MSTKTLRKLFLAACLALAVAPFLSSHTPRHAVVAFDDPPVCLPPFDCGPPPDNGGGGH